MTDHLIITEPGIYRIPTGDYHADPVKGGSLSSTEARRLIPPSCPAKYKWWQDHPEPPKDHYDIGHAAHRIVLGIGDGIAVIDADNWRTKAARTARDEARQAGLTPLLTEDYDTVQAMAAALHSDPVAAAFLDPDSGEPEQTLVWQDERTGIMCRALVDWLPHRHPSRRTIQWDYKTCVDADPEALAKAMHRYGYHQQADWYRAGARALGAADPHSAFVFICQEKTPPYLATVIEPDANAMRAGLARNRWAIDTYKHCTTTNHWPGYSSDVVQASLPRWAELQEGIE